MNANNMTVWPEIACQRGHDSHDTLLTQVKLSDVHGFRDLPQVPAHLAIDFDIEVWDWTKYPDGYCPAHDAVSETIDTLGIWEPAETALVLDACRGVDDSCVLDFGAQVGWFTLLAALSGVPVLAIEADPECARLIERNAARNGVTDFVEVECARITGDSPLLRTDKQVRLLKADVEGAEKDVARVVWPLIEGHQIDYLLLEVSPVFDDYYGALITRLARAGYTAYLIPPKRIPPYPFERPLEDVKAFRLDPLFDVSALHQEDVWFVRDGL